MICPKCSTELLLDYTFCPQCGSKLPLQEATSDTGLVSDAKDAEMNVDDQNVVDSNSAEVISAGTASDQTANGAPIPPESARAFTNPDDIFSSSSPLTQTMPSSYVSPDASVFVAASSPAAADTVVKETVSVTPYVVSTASAGTATPANAAAVVNLNDSKDSASSQGKPEPVIPKEYKALSTAGIFWYMILVCIPVVGWIILLSFAFGGKNKSKKSLSRAILLFWIIFILLVCLAFITAFIANKNLLIQLFDQNNWLSLRDFISQTFINR